MSFTWKGVHYLRSCGKRLLEKKSYEHLKFHMQESVQYTKSFLLGHKACAVIAY